MEYNILVNNLSERTGINRNLFQLDFEPTQENELILVERQSSNHYYFSQYEYWANINERWKSIVLFIPNGVIRDFLEILNSILEEYDEAVIDLNNIPDEFSYNSNDNSFNVLLGQNKDEYYRIELAKIND
jgi:hypothetical protein